MNVTRLTYAAVSFVFVSMLSIPALADDPEIESVEVATEDESASFSIGLDAQVRYELSGPDDRTPTSQFSLRRFRPILGFKAFEHFEVKVVPEFAGDPELKDGVVGWTPVPSFSVEAGQFAPPFNWERDGSSDYHLFTERSIANGEFQIADGRDIGVQIDWEWEKLLDLEVGIFNGAGSNTEVSPGRGHIATGRVAYAPLGAYHEVEVVPFVVDRTVLMFAAGGYFALDNAWRDWSQGEVGGQDAAEVSGDVWSVTSDVHAWFWRIGIHAQGFYRAVSPCCGEGQAFEDHAGLGFTGQASFLAVDELLLMAFRYSYTNTDLNRTAESHEFAGSAQMFHVGNQSKFTLDAGMIDRAFATSTDRYIRLQYQLLL